MIRRIGSLAVLTSLAALTACGGSQASAKPAPGGSRDQASWPADDRSLCDWKNKPELEISETAGPGSIKPNVRRVYKMVGESDSRRRALICREIDTNLDGIKDVVRTFNVKGEALHEEADTQYDGRADVWISFVAGRLAEEQQDTNKDGKPDVWKFYTDGQLSRVKRDRNFDGAADVWEVYTRGHLERMGVDDTYDGHVDRWDRDTQAMAEAEQAERKAREAMETARDAGASSSP